MEQCLHMDRQGLERHLRSLEALSDMLTGDSSPDPSLWSLLRLQSAAITSIWYALHADIVYKFVSGSDSVDHSACFDGEVHSLQAPFIVLLDPSLVPSKAIPALHYLTTQARVDHTLHAWLETAELTLLNHHS